MYSFLTLMLGLGKHGYKVENTTEKEVGPINLAIHTSFQVRTIGW